MGERIEALDRLVSLVRSVALACSTPAWALARLALARASVASAVSISVFDGTLPPESLNTAFRRDRLAPASCTVASAWRTPASATLTAARALATWSSSFDTSSRASTCPLRTRLLSSTNTCSMMPDNSLPTLTWLVGCKVPVADTVTTSAPRSAGLLW